MQSREVRLHHLLFWYSDGDHQDYQLFVLPVTNVLEILNNPNLLKILKQGKEQLLHWYRFQSDIEILEHLPSNLVRKRRELAYVTRQCLFRYLDDCEGPNLL